MARHPENCYALTALPGSKANSRNLEVDRHSTSDDEAASDVDEPPDEGINFSKCQLKGPILSQFRTDCITKLPYQHTRQPSLLTQALLKTPDPSPSESEAPLLTSDGGMTSPTRTNTPSPPLPEMKDTGIILSSTKDLLRKTSPPGVRLSQSPPPKEVEKSKEQGVEAGLGRPRCITFACGGKNPSKPSEHGSTGGNADTLPPTDPPKRSCRLRFACPTKPTCATSRREDVGLKAPSDRLEPIRPNTPPSSRSLMPPESRPQHQDSVSIVANDQPDNALKVEDTQPSSTSTPSRKKLKRSEATRFHEFASSFDAEDDWIQEQPPQQEKITVHDTLRKENLIRRLTEEADEEALNDEVDQENDSYDNTNRLRSDDDDLESGCGSSDGGNETDDEGGFADSDPDSDHGSQYHFWTTGRTTAATSTDQVEHIRPMTHRVASVSSIESMMISPVDMSISQGQGKKRNRKARKRPAPPKMRPGTPDLPDSTDFVCGTLDEDRPIEAAYMSCLEERRRARHKAIPQDIDPSFPTSDMDEEDDDDEDDDLAGQTSDEPLWVTGRPDNSDEDYSTSVRRVIPRVKGKSPMPSPKHARSPAPLRRGMVLRSPPPHGLFGRSPVHKEPRFTHPKLKSPPSTRRASITLSPPRGGRHPHMIPSNLAQRPCLTHTTSLPRTPNPFWRQHRDSHGDESDEARSMTGSPKNSHVKGRHPHSRGPINIVRGLENKRKWRRERLYRQQVRHTGKEKERRCQPGQGAERMRELGLEMAGKGRGYCHPAVLVLSL